MRTNRLVCLMLGQACPHRRGADFPPEGFSEQHPRAPSLSQASASLLEMVLDDSLSFTTLWRSATVVGRAFGKTCNISYFREYCEGKEPAKNDLLRPMSEKSDSALKAISATCFLTTVGDASRRNKLPHLRRARPQLSMPGAPETKQRPTTLIKARKAYMEQRRQ